MEAEFQMLMASGGGGEGLSGGGGGDYQVSTSSPSAVSSSYSWNTVQKSPQAKTRPSRLASPLNPNLNPQAPIIAPPPDTKALKWADINTWFGTDTIMTEFAYKVHDELIGGEGMDPETDVYYRELEKR